MATTRLPMRHLREIFRQKFVLGLAHRAIAQSVGVSLGAAASPTLRRTPDPRCCERARRCPRPRPR